MGKAPLLRLSYASRLRLAFAFALGMAACKPQIGNNCATSTDCSQTGDRLCDVSQPGGYCTIFNCEPQGSNATTKCPNEAACISFGASASPVMGCQNDLGSSPYSRSYCMKKCKNTSDCRDGYVCLDLATDARFGAVDVDGPTKVCTVAFSAPAPVLADGNGGADEGGVSTGVCTGTSNNFSDVPPPPELGNAGVSSSSDDGSNAGATSSSGGANTSASGASGSEGN